MAETYQVNYDILVNSNTAIQSLQSFQKAVASMSGVPASLRAIGTEMQKINAIFKQSPVIDVHTSKANKKLQEVINKLNEIHTKASRPITLTTQQPTARRRGAGGSSTLPPVITTPPTIATPPVITTPPVLGSQGEAKGTSKTTAKAPKTPKAPSIMPKNVGYKILGPSMIDGGSVGALNIAKGMGIAYGISGLSSLIGSTIKEATEYDNLMQSAKNILKTHDTDSGFSNRFKEMEQLVRDVGIKTKFTAPQVADATKFLAMAGFNIDGINKSIESIADIALVGDTDLGQTADVVTNIMTGYGILPENIRKAADVMTMTFTKSNTTLIEIAEAYKYSASLLSAGGVAFEEATAAFGILGNAGIKGSQAGTTMRTIAANLVNPTKKQKGAWDEIGVERLDKEGNLRPLADIFGDLHNKNISLAEAYRLFHKTAAQGAVSLAANVDLWNEIIYDNFLSEGLVRKLAKEKQNTIQGLWYQLTSSFTEGGMQAFGPMQDIVKNFLRETTSWIQSAEFSKLIKQLSRDVFEFFGLLKGVVVQFSGWYNVLRDFIKPWITFQLYMLPVLAFFRSTKAVFMIAVGFGKLAGGVIKSAGALKGLALVLKQIGTMKVLAMLFGSPKAAFLGGKTLMEAMGKPFGYEPPTQQTAQPTTGSGDTTQPNSAGAPPPPFSWGMAASRVAGGAAGGYLGYQLGNNIAGPVGGVIGGAVLGTAGTVGAAALYSKFSASLGAFAGPVGWAALLVAGLGIAGHQLYKYRVRVSEASDAMSDFFNKAQLVNGVNKNSDASYQHKYWSIITDSTKSAADEVAAYIKLVKEAQGLFDPDSEKKIEPFESTHEEIFKNLKDMAPTNWWSFLGGDWYKKVKERHLNPDGSTDTMRTIFETDNPNTGERVWLFRGHHLPGNSRESAEKMMVAKTAYITAFDESIKSSEITEEWVKKALSVASSDDWTKIIDKTRKQYTDLYNSFTPNAFQTVEEFGKSTTEGYFTKLGKMEAMTRMVESNDTPVSQLFSTMSEISKYTSLNKDAPIDLLQKSAHLSGAKALDPSYGKFGTDEYIESLFKLREGLTSAEFRQLITSSFESVKESMRHMSKEAADQFDKLILKSETFAALVKSNGVGYNRRVLDKESGMYMESQLDENGKIKYVLSGDQKTPIQADFSESDDDDGNNNNGGRRRPVSNNDYKSKYSSNTAAPKQIIVKIENMLNVESIDMSKKDNSEIVHNLKEQVAQALIDVVHDFDNSFHG